jgi:hypothetical protein
VLESVRLERFDLDDTPPAITSVGQGSLCHRGCNSGQKCRVWGCAHVDAATVKPLRMVHANFLRGPSRRNVGIVDECSLTVH